jgi:hypothetical protein
MKGMIEERAAKEKALISQDVWRLVVESSRNIDRDLCSRSYRKQRALHGVFPPWAAGCTSACTSTHWPVSKINAELRRVAPYLEFREAMCDKKLEGNVGFVRLKPNAVFPK